MKSSLCLACDGVHDCPQDIWRFDELFQYVALSGCMTNKVKIFDGKSKQ